MDEGREKGDEQSAPSADNSAAPATTKRHNIVSIKAGQNLDGSAASKVDLMREANASLTLVAEIMRANQEYWGFLLTKPHDIGSVQCCTMQVYKTPCLVQSSAHDQRNETILRNYFSLE
jgi:hypothetical protein